MRGERAAPWTDALDRSSGRAPHEFPRVVRFPPCRDGDGGAAAGERRARTLADDQGNGALPQADCAWARSVWLPRVMRAPWMCWAQAARDTLIGEIP